MVSCAPVGNRRLLGLFTRGSGGFPTRRRFPTCPTTSAEFPCAGKPSGIGHECRRRAPDSAAVWHGWHFTELARVDGQRAAMMRGVLHHGDRKSTRLNSSHLGISYAV